MNSAWENWRFQVDSGWNRSNYFAVVETVALAGAWQVLDQGRHPKTALFFAFLGLLSTIIWLLNDVINHTYILYWWRSTGQSQAYESKAIEPGMGRWWPKLGLKYSHLMHVIPIIFIAAWLWMLGLFIPSPRRSYIVAMIIGLVFMWIVLATLKKVSDYARGNTMESRSIKFGDPAMQQAFAEEYAGFLIEYKELMEAIKAIMLNRVINASIRDEVAAIAHLPDDDPLALAVEDKYKANIASFILARLAIDEFSEMLVLASNGLGRGSIKILRSMYERVVTSAYVAQNPEVSRSLVDSTWTHHWKVWKRVLKIDPSAIDRADKSQVEDLENKAAEAQARLNESFCPKCKQLIQVHSWTKVPLSTMAGKIGNDLSGLYLVGYQIPTALAHTTGESINSMMEQGDDGAWTYRMDSSRERRQALHVGHNLLLLLLGRQNDQFGYGLEHLLKPRFEAFKKVWATHYPSA